MTNAEMALELLELIGPDPRHNCILKEAIRQVLKEPSAKQPEPEAEPKKRAAAPKTKEPKKTVKRGLDHGKICALYKANWSIKAIAEEMDSNDATIRYHLKKEGLIK